MSTTTGCGLTIRVPDDMFSRPPAALALVLDGDWDLVSTTRTHDGFVRVYAAGSFAYGHEGVLEAFDLHALSAAGCDWVISDEGLEGEWYPHALACIDRIVFEVRTGDQPDVVRTDIDARRLVQCSAAEGHTEIALLVARACLLTERFGWPGPRPEDAHPDFRSLVTLALDPLDDTEDLAADSSLWKLVLQNPHTGTATLANIARRGADPERRKVIEHPGADDIVLGAVLDACHADGPARTPFLAIEVSSHPAAGAETLRRCAELHGGHPSVVHNVATHANTTWWTTAALPAGCAHLLAPDLLAPPGTDADALEVIAKMAPHFEGTLEQLRALAAEICAHPHRG